MRFVTHRIQRSPLTQATGGPPLPQQGYDTMSTSLHQDTHTNLSLSNHNNDITQAFDAFGTATTPESLTKAQVNQMIGEFFKEKVSIPSDIPFRGLSSPLYPS